jgi:hypothetical protein
MTTPSTKMKRAALAAAVALFSAFPMLAHHAVSAEFDAGKVITLKGVVSKVDWVNPHIFVYVDVKETTVTAYPAKDGTDAFGFLLKLTYADGHFYNLSGNNAPPTAAAK